MKLATALIMSLALASALSASTYAADEDQEAAFDAQQRVTDGIPPEVLGKKERRQEPGKAEMLKEPLSQNDCKKLDAQIKQWANECNPTSQSK